MRHMHMLRSASVLTVLLGALLLAGCGSTSTASGTSGQHVTVNVFAAASLKEAFTEIGRQFQSAHAGVTISFNFGGSDTLAQQIGQGAPADIFASANAKQMNVVVRGGQVAAASVKTFAHNRLVVVYPSAGAARVRTLQDLAKPGVKVVLAAKSVPVGQYALDFLTKASADPAFSAAYKANVLKNVVSYEQDVKSVLAKVSLGEADAGIVYTTDAAASATSVGTIAIPDSLNSIALYPIAPLKGSKTASVDQQLVDFVASPAGQAILTQHGFIAGAVGAQYTYSSAT